MPKWISPCTILLGTLRFPCKISQGVEAQDAAGGSKTCRRFFPFCGRLFSLKIPRLRWFSSSNRDSPPALSQPQARLFPSLHTWFSTLWLQLYQAILVGQPKISSLWLLEGCLCVPGAVPGVTGWNSQDFLWQ